jgi:hypothetical protein
MDLVGEVRGARVIRGERTDDAYYAVMRSDWRHLEASTDNASEQDPG